MIDRPLFASIIALFTLSLIMSYSLSVYAVLHLEVSSLHFFIRQLAAVILGMAMIVILSRLNPDRWFVPIGFVLFLSAFVAMVAMPFLPEALVKSILGAKRWIRAGSISIAPVEFFKVGFVFFLAWSFSRKIMLLGKTSLWDEIKMVLPYLTVFGVAVVLIAIFQKDLGQVAVLAVTLAVLFTFAGRSIKLFLMLITTGIVAFIGLVLIAPHRMLRIKSWWSTVQHNFLDYFPETLVKDLRVESVTEPYQIANSLNAIHNSGFWGQGLGNGQFKLGYLSEVHTDFILAGLTEELGYPGLLLVTLLMLVVVYRIFKIAAFADNTAYYLFSVGIGLMIMLAFLVNSYGISGLTPVKGIAVPFLSYGGSQVLASSLAVGMVLMISKQANKKKSRSSA